MPNDTTEVLIELPKELVDRVDRLVGPGNRSSFFTQAVAEKLDRARLQRALVSTAGFISAAAHPEWQTPDDVSTWVRELRALERDRPNYPSNSRDEA